MDILDQCLLVGNASSVANVTTFNDGVGNLLISGSTNPVFDTVTAINLSVSSSLTVSGGAVLTEDSELLTPEAIVSPSGIYSESLTISGTPVSIGVQPYREINAVGSGTQNLLSTDHLVLVSGSYSYLELQLPAASEMLGRTIQIQGARNFLVDTGFLFAPNHSNLIVTTQPEDNKDGAPSTINSELLGWNTLNSAARLSFTAVGGDYGWVRLSPNVSD